jgi:hypothetical protein
MGQDGIRQRLTRQTIKRGRCGAGSTCQMKHGRQHGYGRNPIPTGLACKRRRSDRGGVHRPSQTTNIDLQSCSLKHTPTFDQQLVKLVLPFFLLSFRFFRRRLGDGCLPNHAGPRPRPVEKLTASLSSGTFCFDVLVASEHAHERKRTQQT